MNNKIDLMPNEEIKQIPGFPNYYATTLGRIWSMLRGGHWLKQSLNKRGTYHRLYVNLGRSHREYVHRIIARTFLENPNEYKEIDHIDGNPLNNKLENLRWVDRILNMHNPVTEEHIKENGGDYCEIEEIATGRKFKGYAEVAKEFNVCEGTVLNHTKNKVKHPRWRLTGKKYSYRTGELDVHI